MYSDGSADTDGYRTMMAMLLAYGVTSEQVAALEPSFVDVQQYLWSHEAPTWPFDPPDAEAVARGNAVFDQTCAAVTGSTPARTRRSRTRLSTRPRWAPIRCGPGTSAGGGDVPQRLHGRAVLGRAAPVDRGHPRRRWWGLGPAPYFHDGSVPDLAGVVDSTSRPPVWKRTGSKKRDYDPDRVGWRYDVPADPLDTTTFDGRAIHDASRPGMSNLGHPFGDPLDPG